MGSNGLQWGRDVSVAEVLCPWSIATRRASLQWGRDVSVAEVLGRLLLASGYTTLQWGRDVSVAEVDTEALLALRPAMLQWGRDVSVAEVIGYDMEVPSQTGFNGAATFPSRKYRRERNDHHE